MKKLLALIAALMLLGSTALAASDVDLSGYSITDASVAATKHVDITAPYSGTLLSYDWETGDVITAGQNLFNYLTTEIYAPESGTVTEIFAIVGEPASFAIQSYGQLMGIEPTTKYQIESSMASAADGEENIVKVGTTVYFKCSDKNKTEANATVISREGKTFIAYINSDKTFDIGEKVTLYRSRDRASSEKVGVGLIARRSPLAIQGDGVVTAIYVEQGDLVEKGQKLFSVIGQDADPGAVPNIDAESNGVISYIADFQGQQVWKGALLCKLELTDELEIVASVDEMDLGSIRVGDTAYVTLDTDKSNVLRATITEISSYGVTKSNAAYYTVHVTVNDSVTMRLGQSASLYLPKE